MSTNDDLVLREQVVSLRALVSFLASHRDDAQQATLTCSLVQQKLTALRASAQSLGKEERLAQALKSIESLVDRFHGADSSEAREAAVEALEGATEKLRVAISRSSSLVGSMMRFSSGPNSVPTSSPEGSGSATPLTTSANSQPSKSPLNARLGSPATTAGLRARSASLQIPKKAKTPPPMQPPMPMGQLSPSGRSPPNSPPRMLAESENASNRRFQFPRHLRFSVATEVNMPSGWSPNETEMAIETFFDGMADLKDVDFGVAPAPINKGPIPFQKSPRQAKVGSKKADAAITQLFGVIEPLLKLNPWSSVFRARLGVRGALLTGQALDTMTELAAHVASRGVGETLGEATHKRAVSLKEFLDVWQLDVDSAVVGVQVHASFASDYVFSSAADEPAPPPLAAMNDSGDGAALVTGGAAGAAALSAGLSLSNTASSASQSGPGKTLDLMQLRERIVQISESGSADAAFAQIKELALRFRAEDMGALRRGDLVVALLESSTGDSRVPVYCRVVRRDDDSQNLVVSAASGGTTLTVRATHCHRLTERSRKLIERGQISEVVIDHYATLRARLAACAREHVQQAVLDEFEKDATSRDSALHRRALRLLEASPHALRLLDAALLERLERAATKSVLSPRIVADPVVTTKLADMFASYTERLTAHSFSGKDRDKNILRVLLLGQALPRMVAEELAALRERLRTATREVNEQYEAVLSGSRKKLMSTEWLTHVREAVNALLEARGFDAAASPHDYITVRPNDIGAIRSNLRILQSLLRNESGENELVQTAQSLRARIYPVCERFINDAIHVCMTRLNCVVLPDQDALEQLQLAARQVGDGIDKRIVGVLEDVVYLREMRRLEDHPQERNPHIVPVSGLVINSVVRKEKEMQTVLEVWDQPK
jgi:hypothetical protein